jgi:hypothetical protein
LVGRDSNLKKGIFTSKRGRGEEGIRRRAPAKEKNEVGGDKGQGCAARVMLRFKQD